MDTELEVKLYHPKNYRSKILSVSNLPETVDQEYLELHLEDICGTSLRVSIDFNEAEHSAYLHFDSIEGIFLLKKMKIVKIII